MMEICGGEPGEFVLQQVFTAAPVALSPHDHRIELSAVKFLEQRKGGIDTHVEVAAEDRRRSRA